ncbi:hypothetical protein PROFUN_10644 [Planoprotostelium fungivorum]|uniref:Uncharacterized protein n=1 Tax=Planoprotostelium fungivorum TaxID=1890364 RepID=A0A2P6NCT8_9EUKA|nr:hypothetical protein PROFUN_10644 [Planoprotostelium fungivorum]
MSDTNRRSVRFTTAGPLKAVTSHPRTSTEHRQTSPLNALNDHGNVTQIDLRSICNDINASDDCMTGSHFSVRHSMAELLAREPQHGEPPCFLVRLNYTRRTPNDAYRAVHDEPFNHLPWTLDLDLCLDLCLDHAVVNKESRGIFSSSIVHRGQASAGSMECSKMVYLLLRGHNLTGSLIGFAGEPGRSRTELSG